MWSAVVGVAPGPIEPMGPGAVWGDQRRARLAPVEGDRVVYEIPVDPADRLPCRDHDRIGGELVPAHLHLDPDGTAGCRGGVADHGRLRVAVEPRREPGEGDRDRGLEAIDDLREAEEAPPPRASL